MCNGEEHLGFLADDESTVSFMETVFRMVSLCAVSSFSCNPVTYDASVILKNGSISELFNISSGSF